MLPLRGTGVSGAPAPALGCPLNQVPKTGIRVI
jgi:hypothetical protein